MKQTFISLLSLISLITLINKRENLKRDAISISIYYNLNDDYFTAEYEVKLLNETIVKIETLKTEIIV